MKTQRDSLFAGFAFRSTLFYRLATGVFEFGVVLKLRGLTLTEYFDTRDPVAATAYYLTLVIFALMPVFVRRKARLTIS